jgi:nucleotide-binding universal stress UspA family protein
MPLTFVVLAGFYPAARRAIQYADALAQTLRGQLVLLHVNRASLYDPYALLDENLREEELSRQSDTAAALYRQAGELATPATVEVATDLLPEVAQDLATRYGPAVFVLGHAGAATLVAACAELLRAGQYPMLVVPVTAAAVGVPQRLLIAADQEPFALAATARPLLQLVSTLGTSITVAHVSKDVEDDAGCAAALRAVQLSGLVAGLPTPGLRGYEAGSYAEGLIMAVQDTAAELVLVLARQRSYVGDLFHRSVTAQLMADCPVPLLVLPTTEAPSHSAVGPLQVARAGH